MTHPHDNVEQRLREALQQEASLAMTMTDTPRELRRWRDNQKHRRTTFRIAAAAAVAAVIAGIVVGVTVLGSGTAQQTSPAKPSNRSVQTSTFGLPAALPSSVAVTKVAGPVNIGDVAFGAVWATGYRSTAGHLYRLDPATGQVLSDTHYAGAGGGDNASLPLLPFRAGHVMLLPIAPANGHSGYLVYNSGGQATGEFIPAATVGVGATDANGAWVPLTDKTVGRVDATGRLVQHLRVTNTSITAVGAGDGAVWIGSLGSYGVERIDPGTGKVVSRIPVGGGAVQVLVTPTSVYVATDQNQVVRIDPTTNKVTARAVNGIDRTRASWSALAFGPDDKLWVSPAQGAIVVLDALNLTVTRGMQVYPDTRAGGVFGLAVTGQRAFLGDGDGGRTFSFSTR